MQQVVPRGRAITTNEMARRIELAAANGCDAIDPDNVGGYSNDNGLSLAEQDLKNDIDFLTEAAHTYSLANGLKHAEDIHSDLISTVDFAVNEQCHEDESCNLYVGFAVVGKNVLQIECRKGKTGKTNNDKNASPSKVNVICNDSATRTGFSTIMKNDNLNRWYEYCPTTTIVPAETDQSTSSSESGTSTRSAWALAQLCLVWTLTIDIIYGLI